MNRFSSYTQQQSELLEQIQQLEKIKRDEKVEFDNVIRRKRQVLQWLQEVQGQLGNAEKLCNVLNDEVMSMDMKVRTEEGHIETHKQVLNEYKAKNETLEEQIKKGKQDFNARRMEAVQEIRVLNQEMITLIKEYNKDKMDAKNRQIQRKIDKLEEEIARMKKSLGDDARKAMDTNRQIEAEISAIKEEISELQRANLEGEDIISVRKREVEKVHEKLKQAKLQEEEEEEERRISKEAARTQKKSQEEQRPGKRLKVDGEQTTNINGNKLVQDHNETKKASLKQEVESLRQTFEELDVEYTKYAEQDFPEAQSTATELANTLVSTVCIRCGGSCELNL